MPTHLELPDDMVGNILTQAIAMLGELSGYMGLIIGTLLAVTIAIIMIKAFWHR